MFDLEERFESLLSRLAEFSSRFTEFSTRFTKTRLSLPELSFHFLKKFSFHLCEFLLLAFYKFRLAENYLHFLSHFAGFKPDFDYFLLVK